MFAPPLDCWLTPWRLDSGDTVVIRTGVEREGRGGEAAALWTPGAAFKGGGREGGKVQFNT